MLQAICPLINSLFFQYLVGFAVMLLGIKAMIYLCNYIFYRFSPVRSFPDVTTLSGWAMVGLLVAFVCPVAFFFCEVGGLFSDQLVWTLLPIIVILIVDCFCQNTIKESEISGCQSARLMISLMDVA